MHTLFATDILSPPAASAQEPNPFELVFNSQNASYSSSANSTQSSFAQYDLLTQQYQSQLRANGDQDGGNHLGLPPQLQLPSSTHSRKKAGNPKLVMMGQKKVGKSSIHNVIFQKLPPAETLYLDGTNRIQTSSMQSFMNFEISEVPSNVEVAAPDFDHNALFSNVGAVIWVLDVQDEYLSSIGEIIETAVFLAENHPRVNFEVFIHKTDGLGEEYKQDTFRDIRQRVTDELGDLGYGDRAISYYQTSIFDHSVYEATSKVIQKLLPQLPALEALLNKLCSACRIQKAYLFDTLSKIYIASDASPTFLKDFEVCSDYIDVIVDIKEIYRWHGKSRPSTGESKAEPLEGESMITLDSSGETYIYAKEINEFLSLVCLTGKGSTVDKRVLIDYNASILQDALLQIFKP